MKSIHLYMIAGLSLIPFMSTLAGGENNLPTPPQMYFADTTFGSPFAKDPDVVRFKDLYYMYYTTRCPVGGYAIGIATSSDLVNWKKSADLLPQEDYETRGIAAPAAIVLEGRVHLFYQTYGNGPKDALCHAVSDDGIHFTRNQTNPVFAPHGDWTCGRAIDADVIVDGDRLLLYWATRDPAYQKQLLGVSAAGLKSGFTRDAWMQICDAAILKPELPWEKNCIEAPSVVQHDGRFYMFYAGAYNNEPQQIGCAVSNDGMRWSRLFQKPLLPNGKTGTWNASESGHPGVFVDNNGKMYLFFQGNNDQGKSWYLSKMLIIWQDDRPCLVDPNSRNP
jgi:predicted GH43/DUF377 family glycosyl hydrolase